MTKLISILALALSILSQKRCLAGFTYSVQEIPMSAGDDEVIPQAINDKGDVAGEEENGSYMSPFLFHAGAITSLIDGTDFTSGAAYAIGKNGTVAATLFSLDETSEAATYSGGKLHKLPDLGNGATVLDENPDGVLVGYVNVNDKTVKAAEWKGGKLEVLSNIPGSGSQVTAISSTGEMVGSDWTTSGTSRKETAFALLSGKLESLTADSYTVNGANDVNDKGDVVGIGTDPQGNFSNFAIIADRIVPLVPLAGGEKYGPDAAGGEAINDSDQIVGASVDASGNNRAVLFENGRTIDLNTEINPKLGYSLDAAVDINNRGQILAQGIANGREEGFILTPHAIPLPASVWMGLTTLPLLGIALRRKRCVA